MIDSRRKGKTGEQEVCKLFESYGIRVNRGSQTDPNSVDADIESQVLKAMKIRIEVKRTNNFALNTPLLKQWLLQVERDIAKYVGIFGGNKQEWDLFIFHRQNNASWVVYDVRLGTIVLAENWFQNYFLPKHGEYRELQSAIAT